MQNIILQIMFFHLIQNQPHSSIFDKFPNSIFSEAKPRMKTFLLYFFLLFFRKESLHDRLHMLLGRTLCICCFRREQIFLRNIHFQFSIRHDNLFLFCTSCAIANFTHFNRSRFKRTILERLISTKYHIVDIYTYTIFFRYSTSFWHCYPNHSHCWRFFKSMKFILF